ncbi:PepSY-like domain-containing protein [Larkinella bovis]|uniref:PepSY-like domain-containing protein n=1 Tax=Larkinella bovis TaxID=683041 RepID=A0ABW0IHX9_9BACT
MRKSLFIAFTALLAGLYGCNPSQQPVSPNNDSDLSATSTARLASDSSGFFCRKKVTKIATTDLPSPITGYISTNYSGATIEYAAKDDTGNFLVAIIQNNDHKTLLFNADGSFNEELAPKDRDGKPGGPRGKGPGRGPKGNLEQIAVTDLPSAITGYITANYAGAELKTAAKDSIRGYLVMIVLNEQPKTLLFNTDGSFIKEVSKPPHGRFTQVATATLPTTITNYISIHYPGSSVKDAAKNAEGEVIVMIKTGDGKPVALLFAADGTFKQVLKPRR